jgi:uncharacterized membrane protein (UPF0127 family)
MGWSRLLRAVAVSLALGCLACPDAETSVRLKGERFAVELADTPALQRVGLMFRDDLPAGRGMLFVFPDEQPRAFWMKNTRIPLDILYFDAEGRLIAVYPSAPPCRSDPCPHYESYRPSRYVLELRSGTAERLGVTPGDRLEIKGIR